MAIRTLEELVREAKEKPSDTGSRDEYDAAVADGVLRIVTALERIAAAMERIA